MNIWKRKVRFPVLEELLPKMDLTKPIPKQDDKYLTWIGKEQGKPCPPIIWY